MLFNLIGNTFGWIFYISKGTINIFINKYKNNKREKRLKLIEDGMIKQKKIIYNLQFDLEEKIDPNTSFGFELINIQDYEIPISLKK